MTRADEYRALAAEGLTEGQAAERLGVTRQAVRYAARRDGLTFRRHADVIAERDAGILELARQGRTRVDIAQHFDVGLSTVERAISGAPPSARKREPQPAPKPLAGLPMSPLDRMRAMAARESAAMREHGREMAS